ncbi:MAG TPA: 2-succinyl-5-enolpyruvyl-6-hydroxy-3-cyclohexene-1-carboxylic-acid synthase [Acidimicrobiia bacterium]|nr:2-succinyl-5-enolpyruvyl-6-hydroxy-3-cyclohexene-1-carboxylic-acid synthase [Acidimicrobiia bacterium]
MTDRSTAFTVPLVRALARLGVGHACITPGSRSTPLALAFADEPGIVDWSHHDERSSAYFAVGIARSLRAPVAIVTTSGTAAAELHPALAEALHARVPLIALTADRPFDLRGVGAPQTMDQQDLYGPTVKWSHDIEAAPDAEPARVVALAARLVDAAVSGPAGPVHLNVRYREPLMPGNPPPETPDPPSVLEGRLEPSPDTIADLAPLIAGRRGIIVAGPQDDPGAPAAATGLAAATGWPILADALSGLRCGPHDRSAVVSPDPLSLGGWLEHVAPEWVVRFGALPTSKALWRWLEEHREVPQVFVEPYGWRDPTASAATIVRADPAMTMSALARAIDSPAPADWLESWRRADSAATRAIDVVLADAAFPNEPAIARVVGTSIPDDSTLWVASSMPIRDADAYLGGSDRSVRVLANRGVNGIDGFISTGLGSAAVDGPAVLLAGDLSVLHDVGALATAARLAIPVTIVVVNNDGGGIFHFLPQEGHPQFERHFGTPHGLDFAAMASSFGVPSHRIDDPGDLARRVGAEPTGPSLLELRTDRTENLGLHRLISEAVRQALADL